jgi:hypothetical protein
VTPALWRAARTDGLGATAAEESAGRVAFLRDLSVLMEGDVARRAARERLEGAESAVSFFLLVYCYYSINAHLNVPVF